MQTLFSIHTKRRYWKHWKGSEKSHKTCQRTNEV